MKIDLPDINSLNLENNKVIIRVDFNVPLDKETREITDNTRIVRALQTIKEVLLKKNSVILMSHLGRPKGQKRSELSLKPVSEELQKLLPDNKVIFAEDTIGSDAKNKAKNLKNGEILLLENLRFHADETSKNEVEREEFAKQIAKMGDSYIDDAFGTCHRAHASVFDLPKFLPSAAGFLLKKEIDILEKILKNPERPFIAIIGGAKVSSKIGVLKNLVKNVDSILIGGAMAYTFLKSRLLEIGDSLVEKDYLSEAFQIIDSADYNRCKFLLPEDHIVADEFSENAKKKTVGREVPNKFMGMDIGPKTIEKYIKEIKKAKTILWNGPMGVFEMKPFAKGTMSIAKAIAKNKGTSIVGGGDSVYAVKVAGVEDKITHVSTGGGATLEYLEGKKLPGVMALIKE